MWRKTFLLILAALLTGSMFVQSARGADYPTKPIEIIVPFVAGAPMDIMSRLISETAPKYLGQPIIVIDKPGGGGSIAAAEVISSKPDGHKLFCGVNNFFALTAKTQKLPFDINSLVPLVNYIEYKQGLCVGGSSPWKTFNDLLDYARKNPGKLRWAHSGRGIGEHIMGLLMFRKAGVETIDIPYKGVPEKVAALLGGHMDASMMTYGTVKDQVKAGKIRYLTFIREQRYGGDLSDVPCSSELGFQEVSKFVVLSGYFIHKDTSEEIKKTLIDVFKKIYDDPEFKKKFEELGDEPRFGGPEFVRDSIKKAEELGVPVLKELGLYVAP